MSNVAALPASSVAWYSSGNVTSTIFLSPAFTPTSCSSKPGMNWPEPSTIEVVLVSNSSPSVLPT